MPQKHPSSHSFFAPLSLSLALAPMATFAKQFSCFLLILLSTCYQSEARESKFFSKYTHLTTNKFVTIPSTSTLKLDVPSTPSPSSPPISSHIGAVPASAPDSDSGSGSSPAPSPTAFGVEDGLAPAPAPTSLGGEYNPVPAPAPAEEEVSYYGLYGKNTNDEKAEEFSTENSEELDNNNNREAYSSSNGDASNDNGFWTSNYRSYHDTNNDDNFNGGYESKPQGMSDTRLEDNRKYYDNTKQDESEPLQGTSDTRLVDESKYSYGHDNENYSPSELNSEPQGMSDTRLVDKSKYYYGQGHENENENYNPNELESEPQGLSDTRLVDNGKYYYGHDNENYNPTELESEPQGLSDTRLAGNDKYYSPNESNNNNEEGYYNGGSYKKSKYEFDTMEEYEKEQGYAGVEQEFANP